MPKMPAKEQNRLRLFQERMRAYPTKGESQFKRDVLRMLNGRYRIKSVGQKMIWEVNRGKDCKGYILDFYLPSLKIAIEIDGKSHNSPRAKTYDKIKDSLAAKKGIRIIRFTNEEVKNCENCIRRLYSEIERWQQYNLARTKPAKPINRKQELKMQDEFIRQNGITMLPAIGEKRKVLYGAP